MRTKPLQFDDFEQFWLHFLSSHRRSSTRWAHVAGLSAGVVGAAISVRRGGAWPLVAGVAAATTLAIAAHPLFEGNTAANLGRPVWGVRAFFRLCARTVSGSIQAEVDALRRAGSGEG